MLISDWSSDVCSSDLSSCRRHCGPPIRSHYGRAPTRVVRCTYIGRMGTGLGSRYQQMLAAPAAAARKANLGDLAIKEAMNDFALDQAQKKDRKTVVKGKRWPVRVELGGSRTNK